MMMTIAMAALHIQPAFSGEPQVDKNIIGSWKMTQNAKDSSGKPCPFVPESFVFYKDHTLTMTNMGDQRLPYKTAVTSKEKQIIEKRVPDLKGKNLLLVRPYPNFDWADTPMIYAYTVEKNELTLILQGWSPAKYARVK